MFAVWRGKQTRWGECEFFLFINTYALFIVHFNANTNDVDDDDDIRRNQIDF